LAASTITVALYALKLSSDLLAHHTWLTLATGLRREGRERCWERCTETLVVAVQTLTIFCTSSALALLANLTVAALADLAHCGYSFLAANHTVAIFARIRIRITVDKRVFDEANHGAIDLLFTLPAVWSNADFAVTLDALLASFLCLEGAVWLNNAPLNAHFAVSFGTRILNGRFACDRREILAASGLLANLAFALLTLFAFAVDTELAGSAATNQLAFLANFLSFSVQLADLALLAVLAWIN
jgi:hypothetical protein